jgi:AmmeMemoRadiSam system protein B
MWATEVRPAVNAGRYGFYPSDPDELRALLARFFESADVPAGLEPLALVAPHAGYVYSGQTAAHAYKLLCGKTIERAIVMAPSHYAAFPGASIFPGRAFATPLGKVPIDRKFVARLMEGRSIFNFYPEAERREHALEVQLPFLQYALGSFELVPLVIYDRSLTNCRHIAAAISEALESDARSTIVVASSDLYHGPGASRALRASTVTAEAIATLDPVEFASGIESGIYMACGAGPITAAMFVAKALGATGGAVLDITTSYEVYPVSEDYVVGYTAVAYHA